MNPILQSQFVQIALPIVITLIIVHLRDRTLLNDILKRLAAVEAQLFGINERLTRLEERTSPIVGARK